jgi:hypothetical protein
MLKRTSNAPPTTTSHVVTNDPGPNRKPPNKESGIASPYTIPIVAFRGRLHTKREMTGNVVIAP